ncbi:tripartite tricarboxylate transporter substrate binding protein [Paeniroseomonas aquatica]|uniref:Tripartite tricarboxylate transporter substrate binding protein n=1 Tax=Paeniroseomonas aquatica TaxID=373043 RepID=A0ABT8A9D2_9PROT|nr:tripartite tricarboxylate transporter substrate binding protein [Paeniroseomonas aquatica]MDN3566026.1 tripartite tricarboxylate transporter substrate binding protein [Paeniroseomonas aquatica]
MRIVVPYPAGGGVDVMVRIVAAKMGERLGQPVVVENRPGANANLGPDHVAKSPADGYTLLASATYLVVNPLLEQQLTWHSGELQPVARLTTTPNLFVVRAVSPFRTLSDFVAQARLHAGLPVGTSGPGAPQSMAMELLRRKERLEFTLVPYRGAPPIMTDLLNGTLAVSVLPLGAIMAIIQGGQFRGLAVTSEDRSPLVPGVPSIAEAGYPDLVIVSWYGLHAPTGTPSAVIQAIARSAKDATADQEVRDAAAKAGGETAFLDTEEFATFLAEDLRRWKRNVAALATR